MKQPQSPVSTLYREREYNYFLKEAMASGGAAK